MIKLFNKNIGYYLLSLVLLLGFGLGKLVLPQIGLINEQNKKIADFQSQIMNYQMQLRPVQAPQDTPRKDIPVVIYTSPYPGADIETASVDLVDQIIWMIRDTQNKIVEISFNAKPADPAIPADVLSLNMSLNSSYIAFQGLLQKVYTWKYLAAIKDITITPLQGDPDNLDIKLTIDLYINKT